MVVTAQDLRQAGISTPILVGGAALTRKFTENKIAPEYDGVVLYAKDAMDGLALANQIQQGEIDYKKKETAESEPTRPTAVAATVKSNVSTDVPVYIPADLERHVRETCRLTMCCRTSTGKWCSATTSA